MSVLGEADEDDLSRQGQLPLSLYVHVPWCVKKCPYCDFNSHACADPPFDAYVGRLLEDLEHTLRVTPAARRPLSSLYLGGGTPSLLPGATLHRLLEGVRARTDLESGVEITLEANPGTLDQRRLDAYRRAGVNRLSIGAQTLSSAHLSALGRIHGPEEVRRTLRMARDSGFQRINLDMMFALPGQDLVGAAEDLQALLDLEPDHLSYYQLTLEPNTWFHTHPPIVPDADLAAEMAEQGQSQLVRAGYGQYEVSAFAKAGQACRHNLNYWRFGDYLGIGAGAHGKLTVTDSGPSTAHAASRWRVWRSAKRRHPNAYLRAPLDALVSQHRTLEEGDLVVEFALNAMRLSGGFEQDLFTERTGLPFSRIDGVVKRAEEDGLLFREAGRLVPTALGRRFVNDLVARFADVGQSGRT